MNWRAGGFALAGAVVGGGVGMGVGRVLAPTLRLKAHNGDHDRYAGSSLLVGASLGAIIGLALASEPSAAITPPKPAAPSSPNTQ
jgi:hypothetical protein